MLYRREMCCCGRLPKERTLKVTTRGVICSELLWCVLWLTLYAELISNSANHEWFFEDSVP